MFMCVKVTALGSGFNGKELTYLLSNVFLMAMQMASSTHLLHQDDTHNLNNTKYCTLWPVFLLKF